MVCVFEGKKFKVWSENVQGHQRDLVDHPGAVVILPILNKDTILLIRNKRFAVQETLWELPAGTLEKGEEPVETGRRELIEETGYRAQQMTPLTTFYTSPGFCNEKMTAYLAEDLLFVGQALEENEKIEVESVRWSAIKQMIHNGTIKDGKSLTTLLYFICGQNL